MNEYLYFQPEYVGKFKCNGAKCNALCCNKGWSIVVDEATYQKYSREMVKHIQFDADNNNYFITMDEHGACPFLTEDKLCRLQRDYGEEFLSSTCATYPRYTRDFGNFFERSLALSCYVAAEMILFEREPMKFEFVRVPEKIHSAGGKIGFAPVLTVEGFAERMLEIQVAMISILQERTLTIDQRLIVLGFFLDKLEELTDIKTALTEAETDVFVNNLMRLIGAYESKNFLSAQVPRMLASISFDARKFVGFALKIFESLYGGADVNFMSVVSDTLQIVPDENGRVSVSKIAANYESLAAEREKFLARCSTFLENYLVNELFMNCFPWRYVESITINYGVFVTSYKIFELILFAATLKGFDGRDDLLKLVDWYTLQTNHDGKIYEKFSRQVRLTGDIFSLTETLLEQ